jgi:hypothetical protein
MSNREDLAQACDWFGESSVFGSERTGFLWTAFLAFRGWRLEFADRGVPALRSTASSMPVDALV